jgi:membrane protein DedA with SNARE-associated domain
MEQLVQDFIAWMSEVPPLWAYGIILLIAYGENIVPPIPGDLIVVFGGYLVGIGRLDFILVVLLSTLGGALGFMTMYLIGIKLGRAVLDPDRFRWIPQDQIEKVQQWLLKWGYGVVLANRFLSGARSVISLTVGMAHMNARKTASFATISAAVWTLLIAYAGYAVGENWEVVSEYLRQYGRVVLGVIVLIVVVQVTRYIVRKRREGKLGKEEAPLADSRSFDDPSG